VARTPHPTDGRTTLIGLTGEGRSLVKRSTAALNSGVFSNPGFSPGDVDLLIRILADFRKNAGDFAE
jgi:DNA-binding MarR family transcriptional regulator